MGAITQFRLRSGALPVTRCYQDPPGRARRRRKPAAKEEPFAVVPALASSDRLGITMGTPRMTGNGGPVTMAVGRGGWHDDGGSTASEHAGRAGERLLP